NIDRDLHHTFTHHGDGWVYARRPFGARSATVMTTGSPRQTLDGAELFSDGSSWLLDAARRTYLVERGKLYVLGPTGPQLVQSGVGDAIGSDRLLLVCTPSGQLEVTRDGVLDRRERCAGNLSNWPMAAAGEDYAALLDPETLLVVRRGHALRLPTRVTGEY